MSHLTVVILMDVLSFCDGFKTHHIGTLRYPREGASTPSTEAISAQKQLKFNMLPSQFDSRSGLRTSCIYVAGRQRVARDFSARAYSENWNRLLTEQRREGEA